MNHLKIHQVILATILGILPSLLWLLYFLKKDPKPEPKKTIILCFFYGILSTIPAIYFESIFSSLNFLKKIEISFFLFAFIEEFFKFFSVKVSISKKREFNEATDPVIYLVTAAMGFALIENLLYLYSIFSEKTFGTGDIIFTGIGRFLGATFLHASSSAILGYFWALSILKVKKTFLYLGLILSSFLHTGFNFAIYWLQKTCLDIFILFFVILFLVWMRLPLKSVFKNLKEYD
ncbi:PrsW family intramembrane metalloprotease [bacterium]|nr:PrsW family intramembrane metalloprotease [bacterium]